MGMFQDPSVPSMYSPQGSMPSFASGRGSFAIESSAMMMPAHGLSMPYAAPAGDYYPMQQGVVMNTSFPSYMGLGSFNYATNPYSLRNLLSNTFKGTLKSNPSCRCQRTETCTPGMLRVSDDEVVSLVCKMCIYQVEL